MKKNILIKLISFWPPFFGAGIRLKRVAADFREIDVELKLRFWNQNYVGTHFGGSLYAMVDPFLVLMLIENLGSAYIVWDKAAAIDFIKPGRGRVRAHFKVTEAMLSDIKAHTDAGQKYEPVYVVEVLDEAGEVVARASKTLYIRKKKPG